MHSTASLLPVRLPGRTLARLAALFARPRFPDTVPEPRPAAARPFAYRLRSWPALPDGVRTVALLRAVTRMSGGPVTHDWFMANCGLAPVAAQRLLRRLALEGSLEALDPVGVKMHVAQAA
jgi:hypothetical protein